MPPDARIALAVAVFLAVSGCSGLLPGAGSTGHSPTTIAPGSYDDAVDQHPSTLRAVGQFKLEWEWSVTFPDRVVDRSPTSNGLAVDFAADRYLMGPELEDHNGVYQSGAMYQEGSRTWQRQGLENGSTVYRRLPSTNPFDLRNYTLLELRAMVYVTTQFPLERNGTAVFQGQRVTRYTAAELGDADRCLEESRYVVGNVTSVQVVALVDGRGVIRKFECELAGETVAGERFTERRSWTVTELGVVEIRRPGPLVNSTRGESP